MKAWVDQEDLLPRRIEGVISYPGSMLRKGSKITYEFARVNGEVVLQTEGSLGFQVRFLGFLPVSGDAMQEFSNFRKFDVQTQIQYVDVASYVEYLLDGEGGRQ